VCTLVALRRSAADWPLLLAANRDELVTRPALPPARHWPDRPEVLAGQDLEAGGSWLGINDWGVVAAVLNRVGTLGPAAGKRSRGELVLEALDHADAADAAAALAELDPAAYRSFNLIVADNRDGFWVRHDGRSIDVRPLPLGLSMITAHDLNDPASPRIRRYRRLFADAAVPDPGRGEWSDWQLLLAARSTETGDPRDAMCIVTNGPYGTCSSSLVGVPADPGVKPVWLYADGRPGEAEFVPVVG
jgi:uncharacterized protein with NRDE domain